MTSAAARMLALTYTLITPTQGGNILRCPLAHFYSAVDTTTVVYTVLSYSKKS
jgi:hypothetical protein